MAESSQAIERMRERGKRLEAKLNCLKRDYDITDPDKVNVTPEQIEILQDVLGDFIESQGNATVKQFKIWVRQNDALNPDEKTAVESVLEDLLKQAPSDWRIEGEFADWMERRIEEVETTNVDIPAGGRTNWEEGTSDPVSIREGEPETYTEEVPLEAGDDPETMTVERSNHGPSVEDIMGWDEQLNQIQAEMEEERVNRRQEARKRLRNEGDREIDEEQVPVGGRSNWENRQNQREESDDGDTDIPAGGRSNWQARQERND
ncbi:hypothetical protein [Salinarchaeum sp. Harcht-Bsk1]|uniref:hypothetical protein n=1 Tax=Salinarchaeum sp. Harcht-Bsk1 TaxID=1333523 RepID=UPI001181AAA8|nr:hypothetical protein [Salinarchaeum sp. Harcht-Bsk1]